MTAKVEELKVKYKAAVIRAQEDAENAPENRVIYLWYSTFLEDFVRTAGLKTWEKPNSRGAMFLIHEFSKGGKVKPLVAETAKKCAAANTVFVATESKEYKFIDFYLNDLAFRFPANYGDIIKCRPFWDKVSEVALSKRDYASYK